MKFNSKIRLNLKGIPTSANHAEHSNDEHRQCKRNVYLLCLSYKRLTLNLFAQESKAALARNLRPARAALPSKFRPPSRVCWMVSTFSRGNEGWLSAGAFVNRTDPGYLLMKPFYEKVWVLEFN